MTKKEVLALNNSDLDRVVKIQGTRFDRKRKVSANTIEVIKWLKACGCTHAYIARAVGVSEKTVKYHTDPDYRYRDCHKGGTHAKSANYSEAERGEYKRKLVSSNAHVIYPM